MKGFITRLLIMIPIMFLIMLLLISLPIDFYREYQTIIHIGGITTFLFATLWIAAGYKSKELNYKKLVLKQNIPDEFESIYKELYNNNIQKLEEMRKQVRWRTIVSAICILIFIIGSTIERTQDPLTSIENGNQMGQIAVLCFLISIFLRIWNREYIKKYKDTYKKEIVSTFIKSINNQLDYNPLAAEASIILEDYKKAEFDNRIFNRFYPDDYLEGFVDNEMFVKMCDLHIQHVTGSGKNRNTAEIFQGIFAQTRCGKDIGTYVKVSKNEKKIFSQQDKVEMDSEEFEKYFDIYSENKIVAMQILTSDIMESLIEFYNKYQLEYEIVFRNNTIYMRFFTGAMFEPEIFGNSMDKQLLFRYYTIFKFIVEICKKVNKTTKELEI